VEEDFLKEVLPHTPTQELYTFQKEAHKGLPFGMYKVLKGL
jgi:hypothetical protein